jgi:hypothetical protein
MNKVSTGIYYNEEICFASLSTFIGSVLSVLGLITILIVQVKSLTTLICLNQIQDYVKDFEIYPNYEIVDAPYSFYQLIRISQTDSVSFLGEPEIFRFSSSLEN